MALSKVVSYRPLLFSIYIDNLFLELRTSGLGPNGCHVGLTYTGAFGYADDMALIAPSIYSLQQKKHLGNFIS